MTRAPDQAAPKVPWRDLGWLALLRLGVSAGVVMYGVVALSDDDYARVTIAQRFAARPRLDPSGTSWLPFPFWVTGTAMKLLDPSLEVARLVSAALSIAATWLLYAAGRAWGFSQRRALVAAGLATITPVAALLGSVTVPELPTAALAVFAIVTATAPRPSAPVDVAPESGATPDARVTEERGWLGSVAAHRVPLLAGMAMLAATLSRYETWPLAAALAVIVWRRQREDTRWRRGVISAIPLLGPVFWIVHNRVAHGDALSFLRRVSSYRAALGSGQGSGPLTYLVGLVGGSPAVMLALALALVASLRLRDPERGRESLARFASWAASSAALVAFLIAGQMAGGAPTHHPERALLVVWLLAIFTAVDLFSVFRASPLRFQILSRIAVALLLVFDYRSTFSDRGVRRDNEERVGQQLRALVPHGERVFAATRDYGYFAVIAAFGRPSDVAIDSHDPRLKNGVMLLRDPWNAVVRLRAESASWLVAPSTVAFPLALQERMRDGPLVIYELDPRR